MGMTIDRSFLRVSRNGWYDPAGSCEGTVNGGRPLRPAAAPVPGPWPCKWLGQSTASSTGISTDFTLPERERSSTRSVPA